MDNATDNLCPPTDLPDGAASQLSLLTARLSTAENALSEQAHTHAALIEKQSRIVDALLTSLGAAVEVDEDGAGEGVVVRLGVRGRETSEASGGRRGGEGPAGGATVEGATEATPKGRLAGTSAAVHPSTAATLTLTAASGGRTSEGEQMGEEDAPSQMLTFRVFLMIISILPLAVTTTWCLKDNHAPAHLMGWA